MKRAGIYNRCSTEEEAQVNALAIQAAESREIVVSQGWQLAEQYIESESGTGARNRSEYQRLLRDMETDKFEVIVIKSIDRLMRSVKDWYLFLDKLTQNNKQLYIYIDRKFYTPDDSLLIGIKAILAEDFSRELSKKIKNAHRRRQLKQSGFNITRPMFGWDKTEKNKFVLNEDEAGAYRLAFVLAKEGKGFYTIANTLFENGVRSKSGIRISDVQWRKMLFSPRAHGTVVLHTAEYDFESKTKRKIPKEEWIYVEDALPAIVSKAYQTEVLNVIGTRTKECSFKKHTRDTAGPGRYELSGKIYCAECGNVYYRNAFVSGDKLLTEWKCSKALKQGRKSCRNRNVIESVVLHEIEKTSKAQFKEIFSVEDGLVDELLFHLQKIFEGEHGKTEIEKTERELDRLKKKKSLLMYKLLDGVIEDDDFKKANRELIEKTRLMQDRLAVMKAKTDEYINIEERLLVIKKAVQEDGLFDKAKMKNLISIIDRIVVYPDGRLEIVFEKCKLNRLLETYHTDQGMDENDDKSFRVYTKYEPKNSFSEKREIVNRKILGIFKERPETMLKEIPDMLGMSDSYINKSVKELKEKGVLSYERYGNTHTGRWIVTDPNK